jgi:hypothetical protein
LSMALGGQAPRLVRQALTESVLLSLFGGAAGLGIAFAGTRLILHFAFPRVGGMAGIPIDASPYLPVLLFAFGVSFIAGLAFGIAPAWMATRVDPIEALRGASRATARMGSLPRKTLVVFQAALSLVLLSASGLLTAALHRLENQDLGFDQDRRIVANISPRLAGYGTKQLTALYQRIHDSLSSIPGVSAAALCTYSPLGGNNWGGGVWVDGHPAPGPNDDNLFGIESPRDTLASPAIQSLEDVVSPSRILRLHATWRSSMKRLREGFSRMKMLLENTSASTVSDPSANTKLSASPKTPAI